MPKDRSESKSWWPICHCCQQPVETVNEMHIPGQDTLFRFRCHGEVELRDGHIPVAGRMDPAFLPRAEAEIAA